MGSILNAPHILRIVLVIDTVGLVKNLTDQPAECMCICVSGFESISWCPSAERLISIISLNATYMLLKTLHFC